MSICLAALQLDQKTEMIMSSSQKNSAIEKLKHMVAK